MRSRTARPRSSTQRPIALLGQKIGGQRAGRPGADDHRPLGQRLAAGRGHLEGRLVVGLDLDAAMRSTAEPLDGPPLARQHDFDGIDEGDGRFVADVEAFWRILPRSMSSVRTSSARASRPGSASSGSSTLMRMLDRRSGMG